LTDFNHGLIRRDGRARLEMSGDHERAGFEALAASGADDQAARALATRLKAGLDAGALKSLAALWLHCAAAAPERTPGVYDAAAEGWLGRAVEGPAIRPTGATPEPIGPAFWDGLWRLVAEPRQGLEAVNLTTKTAALAGLVAPALAERVGRAAMAYPQVPTAVAQGVPKRFDLGALRRYPAGTLAADLLAMLEAEGFDPEPLRREDLGIARLPPPLDYLNARILQCHDLWHLVAGYRTTALHEVAISGFQLAQFGHHYSAMFLGMVLTRVAFEAPEGGPIMLETILTAWAHGRRSPPLLPVKWESLWDKPLGDVRARLKIAPYVSPFPADLLEQLNIPADAA
jgi:ubiquinone biosynthesis protein Coq4